MLVYIFGMLHIVCSDVYTKSAKAFDLLVPRERDQITTEEFGEYAELKT